MQGKPLKGSWKNNSKLCMYKEGRQLALSYYFFACYMKVSGLYCEPVWARRYAHCPSSRMDGGENCKRILTKTRAGYLHLPASVRLLPRGLFFSDRPISWKPNFIQVDLKKNIIQIISSSEEPGRKKKCKTLGRPWKSYFVLIRNHT